MKRFLIGFLVALMVIVSIPVSAFAVVSPTLGDKPVVNVETSDSNAGTVTKEEIDDDTYKIVAHPSPDHTFEGWDIDGDYTIIEGDLNSTEIIIKVTKDTNVLAKFSESSSNPGSSSPTSPTTGDYSGLVLLSAMIALIGAAYACKRIFA